MKVSSKRNSSRSLFTIFMEESSLDVFLWCTELWKSRNLLEY
ncbi:hypothetical protein X975_23018, partial [Stegodyphus mimosarum]